MATFRGKWRALVSCFFICESINDRKRLGQLRAVDGFIFQDNEPYAKSFQQPIWLGHAAFFRLPSPFVYFLTARSLVMNLEPLRPAGPPLCLHPCSRICSFASCSKRTNKMYCFGTCGEFLATKELERSPDVMCRQVPLFAHLQL